MYVEITDKALELLKELDKPLEQLHQYLVGHLSARDLVTFARLPESAAAD